MWQTGADISWLLARLSQIKKAPLFTDSRYEVTAMPHDIMIASHYKDGQQMLGVFSLRGKSSLLQLNAPDGFYQNLINDQKVEIHAGMLSTDGHPIIINVSRKEM